MVDANEAKKVVKLICELYEGVETDDLSPFDMKIFFILQRRHLLSVDDGTLTIKNDSSMYLEQ